ncbi:helix-turn-helix domain-containing protein [Priestia megaterium]|uniref:helix-turn-helix domain-containing protein n=1 Tax=Priestia megaterium TaxID=1404 RepID=UPI00244AB79D|nr:helix-turn-helix transcriptional regulator [Priestia megaterium]MDH2363127.1 helix-turn-helix transcriptional regulator [Priestia megaterium]MDH2363136.1 helix-turn-helix transcriptional regulator [Priestia megaterium]
MSSNRKFDYTLIPHIRRARNLNQEEFAAKSGLSRSTLARIETGDLYLSDLYYSKINEGLRKIRFSNFELESVKKMQTYRQRLGYSK